MNKIKYILISIIFLGSFSACNDILEENPVGLATAESYYATPKGIEDGLKAVYTTLRKFYGQEESFFLTVTGTDVFTNGFGGVTNSPDINNYSVNLLGTNAMITAVWNNFYIGINQANAVISRAPKVQGLSETEKQRIIAEARFIRALYYFHLVQQFGDVHFSLEETIGVQTTANRTPVKTIYDQGIIPDLQFAIANLPAKAAKYGRVTKPASEALLARVQLTLGNWAEAEKLASSVIKSYDFQLLKPFSRLWDITNDVNSEVIWSVQFTADPLTNGDGNQSHLFFIFDYAQNPTIIRDLANGRPYQRFMPTNYLIKLFDPAKDSRWDGTFKTVWIANNKGTINGKTVSPGDTAIKIVPYPVADAVQNAAPYWLIDFNDNWVGGTITNLEFGGGQRRRFPAVKKYLDPLRTSINAVDGRRDFTVLRLAELYLIAGEAAWRQSKNAEAAAYFNVVRTRAAIEGKEAQMQITAADVNLNFILDERARELVGEVDRWYDLKRTGTLLERVKKYNLDAAPNIKEMHLVRPIPQTQLDRVTNPGEFAQNPGY
ncbi:RagB/SusD family nutrient uptake outer membrane protein [Dyadobacter psychrotolerans]|uniref:RagB/SusD family nutrient uptake outer membrane protein n=1 Tax=Dyadobacter psychrotolerans TaxID=2541721 RepID=A0A4R5DLA7_9BACT|nr:RagB/SusD family nutrient uptake outer membrane protein [Dyadobacter psychrotolerans]TDE12820.1 RagB/SusD family nutrient uptake outer membrane protein [Dyadobacter psychrotolerans]